MTIIDTISDDLTKALKYRNKIKISILRLIKSSVKNREIEKKALLDDDEIRSILNTFAKRSRESIVQFTEAGRHDLVEKEKTELSVIMSYLPRELSEDEVKIMLSDAVRDMGARGPKDMGKVMKAVMAKSQGQVDGKLANKLLKEMLEV